MADAAVYGVDINALMAIAGAQPSGSQKARFCSDIATLLGADAIFRIKVGGATKYQTTIVGALASSSAGVALPSQMVEPPTTNVADALTASDAVIEVSNASNQTIRITVPVKSSAASGFIQASGALDGTKAVRLNGVLLTPPATLDASVGTGGTTGIYSVATLKADMSQGNDNGWRLDLGLFTADSNGPGGKFPYVAIARRRSEGQSSHWPGEYLSDAEPRGVPLTDGTTVRLQGWYVVGRAFEVPSGVGNTRVQIRGYRLLGLNGSNVWETLGSAEECISGASWHANFRSPGNETYEGISTGGQLGQRRAEPVANGGGSSLGSIGFGNDGTDPPRRSKWALHGYPANSYKTRGTWLTYNGLLSYLEARLILHDPSGPDDRSSAGLMIWSGADWYGNGGAASGYINELAHGRLKLITNDWKIFSVHDLTQAQLDAYPPPGFS